MSTLLTAKISAVKRKHAIVSLVSGLSLAAALFVAILAATMLIDWLMDLSYLVRVVLLLANLSVIGSVIVRQVLMPLIFRPDDETVSLWVEQSQPAFNSRLISAVQLSRPGALEEGFSVAMIKALIRETEAIAQPLDFARVIATDRMGRNAALAIGVVVLGLIGLAIGGEPAGDLLKRAVLVPGVEVPRKTRVIIDEGDLLVARGDSVTLAARAEGIVPARGRIVIEYASGRTQTIPIHPVEAGSDRFERTIDGVQESFSYRIYLNDGRSPERHVRAEVRPAVAELSIEQIFPSYTGLGRMRRAPGDLTILEGSRLVLRVRASKPVTTSTSQGDFANYVYMHGSEARYRLIPEADDPTLLIAVDGNQKHIPVPKYPQPTRGFSIHLTDALGLTSQDPTVYRLDLQPDRTPTVRVTHPLRREILVTSAATVAIGFDAADDFALGAARIRYRIRMSDVQISNLNGLAGQYYPNQEFKGAPIEAIDGPIDFDWKNQTSMPGGMKPENFTARWTGVIVPPVSGRYTFIVEADDGVRLWVNDKLLFERWQWKQDQLIQQSEPVLLETNKAYPVRIEFRQASGQAYLKLRWRHESTGEVPVPANALFVSQEAWQKSREKVGEIELNLAGHPKSFRGYYEWQMQSLSPVPPPGTMIEWWLEVQDTNDETGPGISESERYVLRLVTPEEKRAELMTRIGETWNPLDSVSERQQMINQDLGRMILERGRSRSTEGEAP